jgi:hypothetical protein
MPAGTSGSSGTANWRAGLAFLGLFCIIAAVVLEIVVLNYHQVTVVMVKGSSPDLRTKTTAGPSAPPASTVATVFALGILLLLVAAFFARITKIVFPGGGELDLNTGAQLAAAVAKKTSDPQKAAELYKQAAPRAAEKIAETASTGRRLNLLQWARPAGPLLDDTTMDQVVNEVANQPGN